MNTLDSAVKNFDSSVNSFMVHVDKNEYLSSALALFLILYAAVAAPQLPKYIVKLFDYTIVKLAMFFLIAYVARKNPTVAIIAAIGLMVTLMTLNKITVNEKIQQLIMRNSRTEGMEAHLNGTNQTPMLEPSGPQPMMRMDEASVAPMVNIPEEALSEMNIGQLPADIKPEIRGEPREAVGAPLNDNRGNGNNCKRVANFRNSFYPQYVNMVPDAYLARYSGADVGGYDINSRYGGTDGRATYGSERRGYDDGNRGSY
jgi:hypothetical protein